MPYLVDGRGGKGPQLGHHQIGHTLAARGAEFPAGDAGQIRRLPSPRPAVFAQHLEMQHEHGGVHGALPVLRALADELGDDRCGSRLTLPVTAAADVVDGGGDQLLGLDP